MPQGLRLDTALTAVLVPVFHLVKISLLARVKRSV